MLSSSKQSARIGLDEAGKGGKFTPIQKSAGRDTHKGIHRLLQHATVRLDAHARPLQARILGLSWPFCILRFPRDLRAEDSARDSSTGQIAREGL